MINMDTVFMQVITVTHSNLGYYQEGEKLLGIFETIEAAEQCKQIYLNKHKSCDKYDIEIDFIDLNLYQFDY